MSKFDICHGTSWYNNKGAIITSANGIVSFCVEETMSKIHWCGFLDYNSGDYFILPANGCELFVIRLERHNCESIDAFERRINNVISEYNSESVKLISVADDFSLMTEVEW